MEEFGDWIYIIVIIIAGVASLINSTRKKARQIAGGQNQPREIIAKTNDGDDFWGELLSQTEQKPVIKVYPKEQEKPVYTSINDHKTPFLSMQPEGERAIELTEFLTTDMDEEYSNITVDNLPSSPDEWRKAFIYNEIFSRTN